MRKLFLFVVALLCFSCKKEAKFISKTNNIQVYEIEPKDPNKKVYGNWVGDFVPVKGFKSPVDFSTYKINIVLQKIQENKVFGYYIFSGKMRAFEGTSKKNKGNLEIIVKESELSKNNGTFKFKIAKDSLFGKWEPLEKTGIILRKYILKRQSFQYDPNYNLDKNPMYIDNYTKKQKSSFDLDTDRPTFRFADSIVTILNASTKILQEKELKNLKKLELELLRNTIYARHGYSFKNIIFGQFFDSQDWYVPVSDDVSANLTAIEKQNIKTLLRFEKYAIDNYESFGR